MASIPFKEIFSAAAIIVTFVAFAPYVRQIIGGALRPHVFSWVIWGTTTFVVFLAQLQDKGGIGAWPIGISGMVTILIAVLAYRARADISITRSDWAFLVLALSALPFWYATSNPLWAVVILTTVDVLGFGPTVRKGYLAPHSEPMWFFTLLALRNGLVLLALENYSWTTVLFPAVIGSMCVGLLLLLQMRRRSMADESPSSSAGRMP